MTDMSQELPWNRCTKLQNAVKKSEDSLAAWKMFSSLSEKKRVGKSASRIGVSLLFPWILPEQVSKEGHTVQLVPRATRQKLVAHTVDSIRVQRRSHAKDTHLAMYGRTSRALAVESCPKGGGSLNLPTTPCQIQSNCCPSSSTSESPWIDRAGLGLALVVPVDLSRREPKHQLAGTPCRLW